MNRFSNITSYKTATAPKQVKTPPPKSNAANLKKWAEANPHLAKQANIRKMRKEGKITKKVADQLLKANYDDRKASIKKPAKGSSGQRSTTTKSTKPAPVQSRNTQANTGSGRDGRPGTGTYGRQLESNPQLKSQTKPESKSKVQRAAETLKGKGSKKPKRSDYPSGRTGALQYAAALRKFRKNAPTPPARTRKYNRRGRPLS